MSSNRAAGGIQPGIKWGPFVMRIPFVHTKLSLPDLLQGFAISGATGLALVPIMTGLFGLTFDEAVTMAMFHSLLICSSFLFLGDPYAPGWLTPAIPFVLTFVAGITAGSDDPHLVWQSMTALALDFAAILIILGATGLGAKLVQLVPNVFKGGIILGAAIAAFIRVTKPGDSANVFEGAAIAGTLGVAICLIFAFSKPLHERIGKYKWLALLASLGLLPGFVVAGVVGYFTGELEFVITPGILDLSATIPSLWEKTSPFSIGFPSAALFLEALPLAFITYILFFGDVVTGDEMIEHAQEARPDEKLEINNSRAHLATGIRNIGMSIVAPFFPTQGVLWTGIQVILLKKWATGRDKMDSFFDGMSSFYVFGLPILYIILPLVTLLKPLLPLALAVTLILTGFACATLALSLVKDATERGAMVLTAMAFSLFEPFQGLIIGLVAIVVLCGPQVFIPGHKEDDFGPVHEKAKSPDSNE